MLEIFLKKRRENKMLEKHSRVYSNEGILIMHLMKKMQLLYNNLALTVM